MKIFKAIDTIYTLALAILSAHVMTELVGNTHICLPQSPTTLKNPNIEFLDNSGFERFSLSSIEPEQTDFIPSRNLIQNTTKVDESSAFKTLGLCETKAACNCYKWETSIEDCDPTRLLNNTLLFSDIKCFVVDCYQNPCLIMVILPLIVFLKCLLQLSYTLTFEVNKLPGDGMKVLLPFRFFYTRIKHMWSVH